MQWKGISSRTATRETDVLWKNQYFNKGRGQPGRTIIALDVKEHTPYGDWSEIPWNDIDWMDLLTHIWHPHRIAGVKWHHHQVSRGEGLGLRLIWARPVNNHDWFQIVLTWCNLHNYVVVMTGWVSNFQYINSNVCFQRGFLAISWFPHGRIT